MPRTSGHLGDPSTVVRSDVTLDLRLEQATDRERTGGKGAALARALRAGHPVVPGFVITVEATAALDRGDDESMAGRYETVADVTSFDQLLDAVDVVRDSRPPDVVRSFT